ncbi:MAG: hypothetical protein K2O34_00455, partial [Acetatifactor sp.]|nr:hypothetical protein [Acetatifactor sp.]
MQIVNVEEYLAAHENRQIKGGKSGAEVWEIEGKYVLKYVRKSNLPEPEMFAFYQNEAYFYQLAKQNRQREKLPCLPEALDVQVSDNTILILMKKYQALSRKEIDENLLRKIMRALAILHSQEIPAFLRQEKKRPGYLEDGQIENCLAGWRSVLE